MSFLQDIDSSSTSVSYTAGNSTKNMPFYIESMGYYHSGSKYYTDRTGLNSFLMMYTVSGKGRLHYKGKGYELLPGEAVLIYCGDRQIYRCDKDTGKWDFIWFHFNGKCADEFYKTLHFEGFSKISLKDNARIENFYDEISGFAANHSILTNIRINEALTRLLTYLIVNRFSPDKNNIIKLHQKEVYTAQQYIRNNFDKDIGIDDILSGTGLSRYYFIKVFKSIAGQSPYEYLTKHRINNAKKLLMETDFNINEVAELCGFAETNNFIKCFKRHTGTTPLKFRKDWNI